MSGPSGTLRAYQRTVEQQRRDDLIVSHLPLVKHVIGRLLGSLPASADAENLESAGVLGLVEAASKFDPTRNAQFKTFAYLRIRGAIVDELRRNSPLPQHVLGRVSLIRKAYRTLPHPITVEALVAATGLTEDEVADTLAAERFAKTTSWDQTAEPNAIEPAVSTDSPDDDAERTEAAEQLAAAIEALPPKERTAVTLYYQQDMRLKEIAAVMNLSVSRVSRVLSKALFELGEQLRAKNASFTA
jgi:RNA polymerase sigma factor FliA